MAARAVIFDLDGTLADTVADIAASMNAALAGLGLRGYSEEDYRRFIGDGVRSLAARVLPAGEGARVDALVAAFRAHYNAHLVVRTRPYDGVPTLLDALVARGVALGVVSNKPDDATRAIVAALFGRWPIGAVAGGRAGVPLKPDPAMALAVAAELGVAPADCVLVGDGETDMRAARAAGIRAVGVLWGFRGRAVLEKAGAEAVIGAPAELLALLP